MPGPIPLIEGADDFTELEQSWDETIDLLNNETIDELADAMVADLAIGTVGRGLASTDASTDFWIMYGCQISGTNPGLRTLSAGAILYQNQVYHVSGQSVTTTGVEVVSWKLKDNGTDVHVTKELEIVAGTAGGEIKDEGDATIFRYGEWIESNTPDGVLSFESDTTVLYNNDVYNYKFRRIGNTLEINFLVTADITTGAPFTYKMFVPLPAGFTKKDPSSAVFCKYGFGRYEKPSSSSAQSNMVIKDFDDGSEGNKVTMLKGASADPVGSQIIMNNAGALTLFGNITVEIE